MRRIKSEPQECEQNTSFMPTQFKKLKICKAKQRSKREPQKHEQDISFKLMRFKKLNIYKVNELQEERKHII